MSKPTVTLEDIRHALKKQDEALEAAFADLGARALTVDPEALRRLAELGASRPSDPTPRRNATPAGVRC
jgi:hypothetical protein